METYDWSAFTKRIPLKTTIETVYNAWTTPSGLESWFLRKAEFKSKEGRVRKSNEFIQLNDEYEWMWFGYDDSTVEHGLVLEINGKDFFKFSFGKAGIVSLSVKLEEGETIVELTQSNIPIDAQSKAYYHLGCSEGWTFYLANLKSILEGGIDLRNKNEKIKKSGEFLKVLFVLSTFKNLRFY
ncbi:SRPBCC family protein [Solitalea lacus]|uniref:SRPBCC family protein n=1 Tax=Solitalea lacus TaxID=2911172 RepID=UPI001EDA56E6|nr:SRPBCC domain-containing protein [Solitalea lacus]UKJ08085.1 SRPBCC domain-containing protein [Solitalea lacus]